MTDTLEAPVVVEETTISMVRPTDAGRLAEIVVVRAFVPDDSWKKTISTYLGSIACLPRQ